MKKHNLWMLISCILPLLLIFLLPLLGATGGELLFIFLILCFVAHLLMLGHHLHNGKDDDVSGKGGGKHEKH